MKTHAIMWEGLTQKSLEYVQLRFGTAGIEFDGTMLAAEAGLPLRVDYSIRCDSAWVTRNVVVSISYDGSSAQLHLQHDGEGNWLHNGTANASLRGCLDVDLEASPATNTLPIRRLALPTGMSKQTRSAWVRVPSLRVDPVTQTYQRLAELEYQYSDRAGAFRSLLQVDQQGVPTSYGSLWRRVCV